MPPLPSPVRAALGLAATMLDEARRLPDRAIELPMQAVSQALALSLRAQQRYAALAARGDEIMAGRQVTDEPPEWATFDEPVAQPRPVKTTRPVKTVNPPRNGKASAFDTVVDEPEQ
ncbi:MAG TPA: hypothetical protein VGH43_05855 [Jatrophihabitans sp.]|jgi:hypothetical protein